ncbi:hypothetical protein BV22DRAFT_1127415 [Leucogyrophana mollusca]|uniref:Uncharacterized protein n=1 Tax=Leucogyrophana mollusca TaxID=85980 RepID=A0ACB8BQ81_9AGAM|nr:hypothetical protein BV22DRAFT_1127415 [Leucogyrophana mollusca]
MDELVRHCLRELSFDGDLGCDVSRLKDFIVGFYSVDATHPQVVDDAFCAFVWSVVVQQPTVRVGTPPPGVSSEVYIAPQTSARRKAAAKGEEHVEEAPPALNLVPDARNRSLEDLRAEYGDGLRIAVDPETSFAAITGSHIRPQKLSPMVYSALQLITRGREAGITTVALGRTTKYDQKTCFYVIKQLLELGLVIKARRGGVGNHSCIHKYFVERSALWQQIHEEEAREDDPVIVGEVHAQTPDDADDTAATRQSSFAGFDPIDSRHLSSLPLVRNRVVKLLKASKNYIHASNNLLMTIGFTNPTKTDRRFFQTRLRELIQQGVVERVMVPSSKIEGRSVKCIRLITPDNNQPLDDGIIVDSQNADDDEKDMGLDDGTTGHTEVKANRTIHKQVSDLLEEAGSTGMTLNEICTAMGNFDKRTIELLLTRATKNLPPSHLRDLGTADFMETFGRERRHRYYTIAAYRTVMSNEQLDDTTTSYADVDLSNVGEFAVVEAALFYDDEETLHMYQDTFKDGGKPKKAGTKIGRPRKKDAKVNTKKRKRDEISGAVDQDGDASEVDELMEPAPKPKRARPHKKAKLDDVNLETNSAEAGPSAPPDGNVQMDAPPPAAPEPKKRGRPRKNPDPADSADPVSPRKPGRPPKKKADDLPADSADAGPSRVAKPQRPARGTSPVPPKKRGRRPKEKPASGPADGPAAGEGSIAEGAVDKASSEAVPLVVTESERQSDSSTIQVPDVATSTESLFGAATGSAHGAPQVRDASNEEGAATTLPATREASIAPDQEDTTVTPTAESPRRSSKKATVTPREDEPQVGHRRGSRKSPQPVPDDIPVLDEDMEVDELQEDTVTPLMRTPAPPLDALTPVEGGGTSETVEHAEHSRRVEYVPIDPTLVAGSNASAEGVEQLASLISTEKRDASGTPASERPSKRARRNPKADQSGSRANLNISHLRRENELFRVIQNFGGIANLHTKEFLDAHMALLETMSQTGEPTSAPVGTRVDKRTATAALKSMESRGRIKMLGTSVVSPTGASRPACLLYLPETPQEKIHEYLRELSRTALAPTLRSIKTLEEPVDYGSDRNSTQRAALPLQLLQLDEPGGDNTERWNRNAARAEQLFSYHPDTIREVLLTERTTLSQMYGYLVGKAVRLREFHLFTLGILDQTPLSPRVVSHEHRIIDISLYQLDTPLSTYCALVSVLSHDEGVLNLLQSEHGRQTPVQNLPSHISSSLQVGRARTKSRILDLMDTLRALGLVIPLEPSSADTAEYVCAANGDHPVTFKTASLEGWTVGAPMAAPQYWRFKTLAPLHLWATSESFPPYWRDAPLHTRAEAVLYWQELQNLCLDRDYAEGIACPTTSDDGGPLAASVGISRSLRRRTSWRSDYVLTWHQRQFLGRYVNMTTGHTPLDDEDADSQLQHICHTISAPRRVVVDHFTLEAQRAVHEIDKARRRQKRVQAEELARQNIEAKAVLQKKAEEAKLQREQDWESLIHRMHQEPLKGTIGVRIRAVRSRFMQSSSTKDVQKWEGEIQEAIKEAKLAAKKVITKAHPTAAATTRPTIAPPPVVSNAHEKPVDFLVSQQGPPQPPPSGARAKGKGKGKGKDNDVREDDAEDQPSQRRSRFQWNREYDELARDASAIIRARCRGAQRLDLSAYEQVFPSVPRNSVRNRVAHLRENAADDAYMKRLEDRWYTVWLQHRGSNHLPDEDPQSLSNFNIIEHIEFLRRHIDKNALRVGFVQRETLFSLPSSVEELSDRFEVVDDAAVGSAWDFLWNVQAEEGREKRLVQQAFTKQKDEIPFVTNSGGENVQVAEAALKASMVFGTPNEHYEPDAASSLLRSAGQQAVSLAIPNLLRRGILSKLVRDPKKSKPGRTFKISDVNSNAIGGSISRGVFQDACTMEDIQAGEEAEWSEWPLVAADGDVAALLELVSEDKVEFDIDLSHTTASRAKVDWNSKKADDDDIETRVRIRLSQLSVEEAIPSAGSSPEIPLMDLDPEVEHAETLDGLEAACKIKAPGGLIDCAACLRGTSSTLLLSVNERDAHLARRILELTRTAGTAGITKAQLLTSFSESSDAVMDLVQKVITADPPLLRWTGYTTPVLVSSDYIRAWAVVTCEDPRTLVLPRRWLDIRGLKVGELWEAALKAVVGVILFRPGISQTELRWRLRAVYDRLEVIEVLDYLQREGFAEPRYDAHPPQSGPEQLWLSALGDGEEQHVFWFIRGEEKCWYRV